MAIRSYMGLEREHAFYVNNALAAQATATRHAQKLMLGFHGAFLGSGSWTSKTSAVVTLPTVANWTVVGSSNSTAAGLDGVDRLTTSTNFVWANAGSAHSWVVYRRYDDSQVCIDMSNSSAISGITVVVSPTGVFTGGTTTNRPTAADQYVPINNAAWGEGNNAATNWHVIKTTDGKQVIVLQDRNGWAVNMWICDNLADPNENWQSPVTFGIVGTSATAPSNQQITPTAVFGTAGFSARSTANMVMSVVAPNVITTRITDSAVLQVTSSISGKSQIYGIGLISTTTGSVGFNGRLADVFIGRGGQTDGRWYGTSSLDRAWAQFGVIVLPWNQTMPATTGSATYFGDVTIAEQKGAPPIVFLMQAWDSVTEGQYTWLSHGRPDFSGVGYPGPNTPTLVSIASRTSAS